jgi:hypothetical protein
MAEPTLRTIQARFGFADPDLKMPMHDQIIRWLQDNTEDILMWLFKLNDRPRLLTSAANGGQWERPVRLTRTGYKGSVEFDGYPVGFVDFYVHYTIDMPASIKQMPFAEQERWSKAFRDIPWHVVFEAKTKIESLGELFRQVKLYREGAIGTQMVRGMAFVVVCPDATHEEIIEREGFRFLKYDPTMRFPTSGM